MGPQLLLSSVKPPASLYPNEQLNLQFEGTNGSTTFTDSSPKARVPTVEGNAQITTVSPIVGTSSGLFDGSGDDLKYTIAGGDGVVSGDFSIKGKLKTTQSTGVGCLFAIGNGGADAFGNLQIAIYMVNGKLRGSGANSSAAVGTGDHPTFVADGNVHDFELKRTGNVYSMNVDNGTPVTTTNSIVLSTHTSMYVGSSGPTAGYWYNGRIDALVFAKA